MSLFLITGSAGTGKSTVCRALKERGYTAYDADIDGLAKWTNLETGYVHPKSSVKNADRTPEFLKIHGWHVSRKEVEQLSSDTNGKIAFLCGTLGNEDELRGLFTGIFALHTDEDTLKHRLATRTDNDWGKQEHELQQTLEKHQVAYDKYREIGAMVIDAARPLEEVVDDILSRTATDSSPLQPTLTEKPK